MTTDEPTGELRCSCGYLLQGLTEKRCPECGRPFPRKPDLPTMTKGKRILVTLLSIVAAITVLGIAWFLVVALALSQALGGGRLNPAAWSIVIGGALFVGLLLFLVWMILRHDDKRGPPTPQ